MARNRNFKAEYERRIQSATKRGLSRSQARGHARTGELSIRPVSGKDRDRFEAALKLYRQGGNQTAAAKSLKLAPERLRRFLRENVQIEGRGRSRTITDRRHREMIVISNGEIAKRILLDFDQASLNGEYLNAIKRFRDAPDIDLLTPFIRREMRQVILCDFLSMYPTVCTLMGLWQFVISTGMTWRDATAKTRGLLETVDLEQLQAQPIWAQLSTLVRVLPDGDIFPVRAAYASITRM